MKKAISVLLMLSTVLASIVASPMVIDIKFRDKKQIITELPTIRTKDGAKRVVVPREFLNRDSVIERILIYSNDWKAKKGDAGWYLLPLGQLIEFNQDNGKSRVGFVMTMFGVKTSTICQMAIIKSGAYSANLLAEAKDGKYTMALQIMSHHLLFTPKENLVVDIYTMPFGEDNYSAMARKYRNYQIKERGCIPLKERVKNNPILKKSVDNIIFRVKHGIKQHPSKDSKIKDFTPETELPIFTMNTFDEMTNFILWFKKNGMDCIDFHCVGWNKSGHDGRYPQLLPVEPQFGGEERLRNTIKTAIDNGYQISCHTNYTDAFKIADNWDDNLISCHPNGKIIAGKNLWSGGRPYPLCPKQVVKLRLKEDLDIVKNLGFNGMHHIDVLTCTVPYDRCYSKEHPCSAEEMAENYATIMKACKEKFGGFTSECSSDYAAAYFDYCLYVWGYPNHYPKKNKFVSKLVPIWQIAFHGIIMSNPFWDTVDPTYEYPRGIFKKNEHKWERILNVVEFGGRPSFYFANYKKSGLEPVKEMYELYQPLKYLQYEFIDEHKEISPKVFLTRYSDGSETVCNYNDTEIQYKDSTIKAHDFKLFKPKKN